MNAATLKSHFADFKALCTTLLSNSGLADDKPWEFATNQPRLRGYGPSLPFHFINYSASAQ